MTAKISALSANVGSLGTNKGEAFRFGDDNSGQLAGFRNKLINGNFDIWQRGTSFPNTVAAYTADRWAAYCDGTANLSISRTDISAADQPKVNANYVMAVTRAGTPTSNQGLYQRIENLRQFIGKTFTLGFQSYGSGTLKVDVSYSINGSAGPFVSVGSKNIALTNDWDVKHSHTVAIPVVNCTPNSILQVIFDFVGAGATTFLGNVQFEEGSIATPFEQRPIGLEFSLCQRYYETGIAQYIGYSVAGNQIGGFISYNTTKRTTPSVTLAATPEESNNLGAQSISPRLNGFRIHSTAVASSAAWYTNTFYASAEL